MRALALACLVAGCDVTLKVFDPAMEASMDATPFIDEEASSSGCTALPTGASCTKSSECCTGLCALDPGGKVTCRPTPGCLGVGAACTLAGACCSLACASGKCAEGPMCVVAGGVCTSDVDCCSNACGSGGTCLKMQACSPAGDTCKDNPECCGKSCVTASDGKHRCELLQACRVAGEACESDADCCSSACKRNTNGRSYCALGPTCAGNDGKVGSRSIDEVCGADDECHTRRCEPTSDGVKRCAPLGGCLPQCELCGKGSDCCSGVCDANDGGGPRQCQPSGCGHPGEHCGGAAECCNTDGEQKCTADPGSFGASRCTPVTPCAPDANACAFAHQCCSGTCNGGPTEGTLACHTQCLAADVSCTGKADCCGPFVDCMRIKGSLECTALIR